VLVEVATGKRSELVRVEAVVGNASDIMRAQNAQEQLPIDRCSMQVVDSKEARRINCLRKLM
jgi:hypothetical protein